MARVHAFPREIAVAVPPGFPKARVEACVRRARETMDQFKAVGETVASVEISPEGIVRVLTPAGLEIVARAGGSDWD